MKAGDVVSFVEAGNRYTGVVVRVPNILSTRSKLHVQTDSGGWLVEAGALDPGKLPDEERRRLHAAGVIAQGTKLRAEHHKRTNFPRRIA